MPRGSIYFDDRPIQQALSQAQKQIPFATALALNDVAFGVMRAENAAMSKIFDHPRPFTQNSSRVEKKASKQDLTAVVSLKAAQAEYLDPYETGGLHHTPGKGLLVPSDIKLDQYGQLPRGAIKRLAGRKDVFVGTVHGITGFWLRPPALKRNGQAKGGRRGALNSKQAQNTGLTLLLRFGTNEPVKKRLDYRKRGIQAVNRLAPAAIATALQKALRTARR